MMALFQFLSGMITMGFLAGGLFFLRFWKRTHDRLFIAFAAAFWLLGATQALLALTQFPVEERSLFYLIRLTAFVVIIVAVVLKNRKSAD